jgi:hypothetical protein
MFFMSDDDGPEPESNNSVIYYLTVPIIFLKVVSLL